MTDTPKIWVGCLATYNAGNHHGKWIDCDMGEDSVWDEIKELLRTSKHPNVRVDCPEECESSGPLRVGRLCPNCEANELRDMGEGELGCMGCSAMYAPGTVLCTTCKDRGSVPSAESWEIFDTSGFGKFASEIGSIELACKAAELIEEHGGLAFAAAAYFTGLDEIEAACKEKFCGLHKNAGEMLAEQAEQNGDLEQVPEHLRYYIDWEGYADQFCTLVEVQNPADYDTKYIFDTER